MDMMITEEKKNSVKENMSKNNEVTLGDVLDKRLGTTRKKKEWWVFAVQTLCVMLVVYLLLTVFFGIMVVHGDSMSPTFNDGDVTLIWRLNGSYKQKDIVLFESDASSETLVKRVIAGPGDTVEITNGLVIVNDAIVEEPYIYSETEARGDEVEYPITLGDDEYFVLGDNRMLALDSRSSDLGLVHKDDIIGKILFFTRFNVI